MASNTRARWLTAAAIAGAAGAATAAVAWERTRRADAAALARDPHQDILDAPLPGRGRTVVAEDGTRLAVWEAGPVDGPPVVFAHGWGMGVRFWIHQLRELSRDHRVIAYDQRGHIASSPSPVEDYSLEAMGRDLESVLRATVRDGRKALLVGHSMGAMTIIAWAHQHAGEVADRIHGAVLADTGVDQLHSTFFAELGLTKLVADTVGVRAMRSKLPIPRRTTPVSNRVTRFVACGEGASASAVALTEQLFLDCPTSTRSAIAATLSELNLAHGLASLRVPVSVVIGTADRLTPPVHSRRMVEALPDAELVEFPEAGHQAPLEQPERFTALLHRRIAEARAAGHLDAAAPDTAVA